jgi:hypothetical protein
LSATHHSRLAGTGLRELASRYAFVCVTDGEMLSADAVPAPTADDGARSVHHEVFSIGKPVAGEQVVAAVAVVPAVAGRFG